MKASVQLAATLNLYNVKPESGSPMLGNDRGAQVLWSATNQCWVPYLGGTGSEEGA